jgi:hypothetical protein
MTPKELNEGVRFTVDGNNEVTAVVLTPDLWRKILHTLEDSEERELVALLKERTPVAPLDFSALRMREPGEDWA